MDAVGELMTWIGENESILSGIAAVAAISAMVIAMSSRTLGLFRRNSVAGQPESKISQTIRYTRTVSGERIAWSVAGEGYPLVRSLGWFTNLEMEWDSPVSSAFCQKLASRFQLVRYDGRGMGLSDRGVREFSPRTRLEDLEAVIDASGLERFALLGMSEGGSTAVSYAARHPEKVSHLILWGSFMKSPTQEDVPQIAAISRLVAEQWGSENTAFHQMFTATFLPDGNADENRLFNDMQKVSASAETVDLFLKAIGRIDVSEIAPHVRAPALILHRKGDLAVPVRFGREFAAQLPNSRLVLLEGNNHWFVTEDAGIDEIVGLIESFIAEPG